MKEDTADNLEEIEKLINSKPEAEKEKMREGLEAFGLEAFGELLEEAMDKMDKSKSNLRSLRLEGKRILEAFARERTKKEIIEKQKSIGRGHVFLVTYMKSNDKESGHVMAIGTDTPEEIVTRLQSEGTKVAVLWSRRISMKRAVDIGLLDGVKE